MYPRKTNTMTHRVDLVHFMNATSASGRYLLIDREKIQELLNSAEELRTAARPGGVNPPLAARLQAMEDAIKDLAKLKPLRSASESTVEATPEPSSASSKATKRPIVEISSSESTSSEDEKEEKQSDKPGTSKNVTPKKPTPKKSSKVESTKKKIKKEAP